MEIKHIVETSEQECTDLYMSAISVATASYPSIEEQNAAITAAMVEFKKKLDDLVGEATAGFKKRRTNEDSQKQTPYWQNKD